MRKLSGKLVKLVVTGAGFVAALTRIADYLGLRWPGVAGVLSSVISSEGLNLLSWLLFLFAAVLGFWWLDRRVEAFEQRLRKLEGVKEPYVLLQPGEIIHPSPDGVLWKWDAKIGADGPFCPRHRERLFHKNWLGDMETENFDEGFLNETFWLMCPTDQEDFKLSVSHLTRVGELRAQAAARLQDG